VFDRTKLHESRLFHFGYFRYLPNLMQKIGIALPSLFAKVATASLAGMMVVGWA
jgi:hypothetical protein